MVERATNEETLVSTKSIVFDKLFRGLSKLPLRVVHAIAAVMVIPFLILPSRHRTATWRNIRVCFPEAPLGRQIWWFVRSLQESIKGIAEMSHFWYRPRAYVLGLIQEIDGGELLEDAIASGRPVLVGAPHLGAWELLCLYLSTRAPCTFIYREPRDPAFEQLIRRSRERLGAHLVRADAQGVRELVRRARAGDLIGMMPDHQPRRGQGIYAPFFGYKAYTMVLFGKLARRENTAVLVASAERRRKGRGFRLHFRSPNDDLFSTDDNVSAAELNRTIEAMIRENHLQYEWTYKRFSMQPGGREYDYGSAGPEPWDGP